MATARTPRITGAFQGAMPTSTPTGSRSAMARVPGLSDGMTSPWICVVSAAASRSMLAASMTLKPIQGAVAPVSAMAVAMNSGARASSASAACEQDRAAGGRAGGRPAGEGRGGGLDGAVHVGAAGGGGAGGDLAGHRVPPLEALARFGRRVGAVDQHRDVRMSASPSAGCGRSFNRAVTDHVEAQAARRLLAHDAERLGEGGLEVLGAPDAGGVRPAGGGGDAGIVWRRCEGEVEIRRRGWRSRRDAPRASRSAARASRRCS